MQDKSARQLGGGGGGLTEDEGEDDDEPPLKKPKSELVKIGGQEQRVVHGVANFVQESRKDPARIPRSAAVPEQQQEEQQQQDWEQENEQEQEPEQMQQVQQQQQQQWSMDSIMEAAMYKLVYGE